MLSGKSYLSLISFLVILGHLLGPSNSREVIFYSAFKDSRSPKYIKVCYIFQNIQKRILDFFFNSKFISEYNMERLINKLWLKATRFISLMSKSISESIFIFVNYWLLTLELVIFQKMELLKPFLNKFDAPIKLLVKLYF